MTDIVLNPLASMQTPTLLNDNLQKVEDRFNNEVVHRSGGKNTMNQDLDMNGNELLNVATNIHDPHSLVKVSDLTSLPDNIVSYALQSEQYATNAGVSASQASSYANQSKTSSDSAAASASSAAASVASAEVSKGYATQALMFADLSPADGTVRLVTNDPTNSYNGSYRKVGAQGTGSWAPTTDRIAALDGRLSSLDRATAYLARIFVNPGYTAVDGSQSTDATWSRSNYIDMETVIIGGFALAGHTSVRSIEFFDAAYVSLGYVAGASIGAPVTSLGTIPAGARYVRFVRYVGTTPALTAVAQYFTLTANPTSVLSKEVAQGQATVDLLAGVPLINGYVGTDGYTLSTDSNWRRTDYLAVVANGTIAYTLGGHTAIESIAFYDAKKQFISGVHASVNNTVISGIVPVPATAYYARLSFDAPGFIAAPHTNAASLSFSMPAKILSNSQGAAQSAPALTVYKAPRRLKLASTDKVILYGDSISSTDYPWYRDRMAEITGANVYNGGFSGYTAAQLAADAQLQRIFDYVPNAIVMLIGANDSGAAGTVGTFDGSVSGEAYVTQTDITANYAGTTLIQAIDHAVRKTKAHYYNIRARAALTGSETEAEKTAKIDALEKPMIILATTLPQQRNNSADAFSQTANWQRRRDAIVEVANRNHVHCVDLFNQRVIDMTLEPYWTSPTNKTTDNGIYTMDGLHPNKWGARWMADVICGDAGL